MTRVFQNPRRQLGEPAAQIDKAIAAHGELPRGAARCQGARDVDERAFAIVDLVTEATAQHLPRVIEPLWQLSKMTVS